jgi:NAD(P)-dependent dehydrogenase (short-subunit alcohol dehydrogenase family)
MIDLAKTPSFRLDGKRALVTGGGRGIGLAAASALAQAGAHVTLAARTQAQIEAAAQAIRTRGDKAAALELDVTDLDAVRRAIAAAEPFDVLVNNAGTNRPAPFVDVKIEDFDAIFALNVRAAFFMAQGGCAPADRGQASRLDHQHLLADGPCRRRAPHRLLRPPSTPWRASPNRWRSSLPPQHPRQQLGADLPGDAHDATVLRRQGVP